MKRFMPVLLLTLLGASAAPLKAQESVANELELIRQLRNKGWHDFAKTKIEELLKRNDPTLNAALPLELARVNISIARQQDPEQRFTLFTSARKQLQDFVSKNQGKPQGALASAELARVTTYHAQALLTRAMREEDNRSRHEKARPAEAMFIQAGQDLAQAIKSIEAALASPDVGPLKKTLENELLEARFDVAVNLFDQGRTYIDKSKDKVNADRAEAIKKAKTAFEALRSDESSQVGWLANAWLMKIAMEQTDPDVVKKYYTFVMRRKDDKAAQGSVQPAIRLLRYFHMQDLTMPREDTETIGGNAISDKKAKMTPLDRLRAVQKEGEAWLKTYPSYIKSYEGQGVLFELAYAYYSDASNDKDQKGAGTRYDKAVKHFEQLAALEGDLSERARQLSMAIKFKRLDSKTVLKTFEEYLMKAMIERKNVIDLSQRIDDPKSASERKKLEEERKKHLKEVINALQHGMALATSKTPVQKFDDARYYLSGAYLAYGDAHRAAIVAEALGRSKPPTRRTPEGAATAIATYSALQNRAPDDAAIRQRLQDMTDYVLSADSQRLWASDPVTSMAHYHAGMLAKRDNQTKKAIAHLEKLAPDFTDYIYTQGQLVFIAEAAREKSDNKKDQQFYVAAAKAAINRMPKLNAKDENSSVIAMYFYAKMEWPKYLYMEAMENLEPRYHLASIKKCNEIKTYVKGLMSEFAQVPPHAGTGGDDEFVPNGRVSKQNHDQIQFSMNVMLKYADLGIAEIKFRGDTPSRFEDVIKATETVVNATVKQAKSAGAGKIALKDYRVTGDILGLALRANVQQGNVDKGKEILDALKRITGEKGEAGGNVVGALLNDIAGQIRRMKSENDPMLKTTKGHYSAFLDEISKEFEAKGYDNNSAIMIAHAFNSLEYYTKAADVFAKVKAPANLDTRVEKKANETDAELQARQKWEEETNRHWGMQVEYIRALRATKDAESLKKAEALTEAMLKHPLANYKVQALMEKNLLLEDRGDYRRAYLAWQTFMKMKSLTDNLANKEVQKVYFTGYFYSVRTFNKIAVHDKAIKDPPKMVLGAANMLIKLEYGAKTKDGWQIIEPLVTEYLKEKEAEGLKKEYDRLKAAQEALQNKTSLNRFDQPNATVARLFRIARSDLSPLKERVLLRAPSLCES